jgi:hypothetical protein
VNFLVTHITKARRVGDATDFDVADEQGAG